MSHIDNDVLRRQIAADPDDEPSAGRGRYVVSRFNAETGQREDVLDTDSLALAVVTADKFEGCWPWGYGHVPYGRGRPVIIYVWTAPGADYPAFVNVEDADDERGEETIKLTVHGPKVGDQPGATVEVTLPAGERAALVGHLMHHFNTRLPR